MDHHLALQLMFFFWFVYLASCFFGYVPSKLVARIKKRGYRGNRWISYLTCFSGGYFMASCFIDIIPHTNENYGNLLKDYNKHFTVPMNQLFICVGCLFVSFMKVITSCWGSSAKDQENVSEDFRTLLVRDENKELQQFDVSKLRVIPLLDIPDLKIDDSLVQTCLFLLAVSFHSFFEGYAFGDQMMNTAVFPLFFSFFVRKSIEAIPLGLHLVKHVNQFFVILPICFYALSAPAGSFFAVFCQSSAGPSYTKDCVHLLLESMAAGTYLYVIFIDIFGEEKYNSASMFLNFASTFAGFLVVLIMHIYFPVPVSSNLPATNSTQLGFSQILQNATVLN